MSVVKLKIKDRTLLWGESRIIPVDREILYLSTFFYSPRVILNVDSFAKA